MDASKARSAFPAIASRGPQWHRRRNITAEEVVIMGKVQGNVDCADRLDIRNEGTLTGDVVTHRFSVEEGAILKGGVEVRHPEKKDQKTRPAESGKNSGSVEGDGATAATTDNK